MSKNANYVPSAAKGEDALFQGSIVLKALNFDEKYQYIADCGYEINDEGKVVSADPGKLASLRRMVKASEPYYVKVDLKKKDGSQTYKSFKDLSEDDDCHQVLIEVAQALLKGSKLGNG